jgi:glyoxylase-like metal-dependent hydrolase (beta-lactamase superfamily II)
VYLANAPGEPLTLVDTGPRTEQALAALEEGLLQFGYSKDKVDRIVITHAHVDHFGLAGHLADASGAQILTHPWSVAALSDYDADRDRRAVFFGALLRESAMPPETVEIIARSTHGLRHFAQSTAVSAHLNDGDSIRLAGRDWQVLHTPGHAAGLICLYEPASQTMLSSDHLLAEISSNPVVEPPLPGHSERLRSLALYQVSLQRVMSMDVNRALPGHGPIIHDVAGLVQERLAFHRQRMAGVLAALEDGARTTWDVTQVLFPNRSPVDTFLAVSEVIGHLELLEIHEHIVRDSVDGVTFWNLTEGGRSEAVRA